MFSRTSTIHPGIFFGRALWAGSVPSRMNTTASRDQFKAIRIGENLVVNFIDPTVRRSTAAFIFQATPLRQEISFVK